jgi:hypothetical protein
VTFYRCDGCKREVGGHEFECVDIGNRKYDLCRTRCYRHYGEFQVVAQQAMKRASEGFQSNLKQIEQEFWEKLGVRDGGTQDEHNRAFTIRPQTQ